MIRYLKNEEIVKKKWDRCIDHSVNGRIYAYSWYLGTVFPEWSAFVMDDYQAVFPIVSQQKMGVKYAFQPVFTQQLGIFTPLLLTSELVNDFLSKLYEQFSFVEMNLNAHNKISPKNHKVTYKVNHELDLIGDHLTIKKEYSTNTKRNIKKAQKASLSIFKNLKPEALIQLFKDNKGSKINSLTESDYQILIRLLYKLIDRGRCEVWACFDQKNELCAAASFIRDQRRFVFLFSATNEDARDNGAMFYLIDSFIESHSQTKMILDFEGSNDPNLARFYKSFGSSVVKYPHLFYNGLSWYFSLAWKMKRRFKYQ